VAAATSGFDQVTGIVTIHGRHGCCQCAIGMTAPARQPHDALFRAVFSQVEHAAGLLATLVPAAFAARVDWNTLAVHPGTYVDERLLHRHSDLLFSVTTRSGAAALLYLLVEHQSEPDRWMALRLHGYVHRI
jgi:predicted transposase/invertase (TIGR01784 family)